MLAFARRKYAEIEYGYPIVVTPGVASARSSPFSFTTIPIISGSFTPAGREAFSFAITSSLSAICFTYFGETKLTASMCWNPASTSSFKYSALYSVGICSGNPCHASRGHSISLICSVISLATHQMKSRSKNHKAASVVRITAQTAPSKNGGGDPSYPHVANADSGKFGWLCQTPFRDK